MTSMQSQSGDSSHVEQLLKGAAQLDTPELKTFLLMVSSMLSSRQAVSTTAAETELIQKINKGLSSETQQRYENLQEKLQKRTITPQEHQVLLSLVDIVEQANAQRIKHLIELSRLRQVSLDEVMKQLEIQPPTIIHV